jgi:hypothetical protein
MPPAVAAGVTPTTASYATNKPDNYYISPLAAMSDPGLQLLYGGADPFANLTPEQRGRISGLEQYVAGQSPAAGGMYSVGLNPFSNLGDIATKIGSTNDPVAHLGYLQQLAQNQGYTNGLSNPYEQNTNYTQQIVGNANELAGLPTVGYNTQLRLVDNTTGQVVEVPNGFAGLQEARTAAERLSADGGKTANWSLYQAPAGTNDWTSVANDTPDVSGLGMVTDFALPLMAMAIPGLSPLAMAAIAAGGSAASSAIQGRSLEDTLKRAAITGGLSFAGGSMFPAGASPTSAAIDASANALGSAAGSAASGAAGSATGNVINVIGNRLAPAIANQALAAGVSGSLSSALQNLGNPNLQVGPNTPQAEPATTEPNRVINVNADRLEPLPTPAIVDQALAAVPSLAGLGALATSTTPKVPTDPSKPATEPSTLDQIRTWLNRASLASSVIGPLAGAIGGGNKGGSTLSPGALASLGNLSPTFSSQLPASNLAARAPRDMSGTDWNRYGMGPERSFFTDVPQRLASGGSVSHGRSDDVPALLSRGEYVIDAETMALLGNGDPDAGADMMDSWRVNVRKHKGRELSKGQISPNAKMPEQYMGGGRT